MNWTPAQQQTIEERDKNILVSAAAGSGKTTVLIERIKQLVLKERVDIDRFLITTFTNAAAAEMKEKMQRAIHQEMDKNNPEDAAFLQRQLDLLPQASISTFHTFALGIMRDFFYLTDLQPGFAIGDETRLSILRQETVDQIFEERFESDRDAFRSFLRKYSSDRNDERLKEQLLKIYQELRSIPRYMEWAEKRIPLMRSEDPLHALGIDQFLLEETAGALKDAIHWYTEAAQLLHREETGSLYLKARQDVERLQTIYEEAEAGRQEKDGERMREALLQLRQALEEFKPNIMRAAKDEKDAYEICRDEVGFLRKEGKKPIDQLRRSYYAQPLEEAEEVIRGGASDTDYFLGLIGALENKYRQKKREENIVDFDDCMHRCIEILADENAAAEYRERFRYIFIDEYQDSNLLQEEIVRQIAREDNLFMVGDVKQSIYKFRLAEPEIFRRRYEDYRSGRDPRSIRIDLNSNFRSCAAIRNAVNNIFEKIMDGYDEDARLNGPQGEEADSCDPIELHMIMKNAEEGEEDAAREGVENDAAEAEAGEELTEAALIAQIIRRHLGRPIRERDGSIRPLEYGDIAVLSRGGAPIPQIERYLNNDGIPAFGETAGGYYETVEIQTFVNLLKVVSNMQQDVPLISAMYSVVFDFTPAELARIRIACRQGSYYHAVRQYEKEGEDPQIRAKIRYMIEKLILWKEIGRTVPLDELMRTLLYETGYYDYCSGLPTGEQRISNLRLLLEKAAAYEETSYLGLHGFLAYIDAMQKTRQKVSEASLTSEGKNAVHIMTVHKSKGLEFPVVILAGAGRKISGASEGRAPAMHKAFGIGLPEVNRDMHWERKTILQKAIAGKKNTEGMEEEIRILYVALTRPKNTLVIVGSARDASRLRAFPGKGSFLEMIYGTLAQMAKEDPAAAQIFEYHTNWTISQAAQTLQLEETAVQADMGQETAQANAASENTEALAEEEGADPVRKTQEDPSREGLRISAEELSRRLSWKYAYEQEQAVKSKYSVTELSRREEGKEEPQPLQIPKLRDPAADQDTEAAGKLTAAEIGTAMHAVMERIDFAAVAEEGLPYIKRTTELLHEEGILTDAEYKAVRPENIDGFFRTSVGARAARADLLCREKEFLLQKEIDGVDTIVQGIIDCYFEDSQGLVLIDYKNSWIADEEGEAEVIRRYAGQISLYREALQLVLGRQVEEAWLYLFRSRKFVAVPAEMGDES